MTFQFTLCWAEDSHNMPQEVLMNADISDLCFASYHADELFGIKYNPDVLLSAPDSETVVDITHIENPDMIIAFMIVAGHIWVSRKYIHNPSILFIQEFWDFVNSRELYNCPAVNGFISCEFFQDVPEEYYAGEVSPLGEFLADKLGPDIIEIPANIAESVTIRDLVRLSHYRCIIIGEVTKQSDDISLLLMLARLGDQVTSPINPRRVIEIMTHLREHKIIGCRLVATLNLVRMVRAFGNEIGDVLFIGKYSAKVPTKSARK